MRALAVAWTLAAALIAIGLLAMSLVRLLTGHPALAALNLIGVVPWAFLATTSLNNWRNT